MTERYVVLGLAQVRATWFGEVSRWATAAVVNIDFVKCVSLDEVRAHLQSGRAFSALLVDASLTGVDRDLVELARDLGTAVVLVDDGATRRDPAALGVTAVLPHTFDRVDLLATLDEHAAAIGPARSTIGTTAPGRDDLGAGGRGRVVAVTGAGGTGTSVIAMALAHGLAARHDAPGHVLLADLALDADQAMLHDARDIVPSVQELVDAFRHGALPPDQLVAMTFGDGHPYRVLLGLRRHRDWTALRPRAWYAALDQLRLLFTHVVADIDPDVEGEAQSGSLDVEDRNLLARSTATVADVVVVTAHPGVQGIHRLTRVMAGLVDHGVAPERLLPIVTRAPRSPRLRAELTRTIAELSAPVLSTRAQPAPAFGSRPGAIPGPVFIGEHRRLDQALRDGLGPPSALVHAVTAAVEAVLVRQPDRPAMAVPEHEVPVAVTPGSLGSWAAEGEPA